jgi:hypothetical protein
MMSERGLLVLAVNGRVREGGTVALLRSLAEWVVFIVVLVVRWFWTMWCGRIALMAIGGIVLAGWWLLANSLFQPAEWREREMNGKREVRTLGG